MSNQTDWTWRKMLEDIRDTFRPSEFERQMEDITPDTAEDDLPGIASLNVMFANTAAMAATFDLPPAEAKAALKEIGDALVNLPEPDGLDALSAETRQVFDLYVPFLRFMLQNIGPAITAVFTHYVDGDYNLADDADALTAQARDLVATDPGAALALLDRVGAMGLCGVEWWWRWPDELDPPLSERALAIHTILEDMPAMESLEVERENWRRVWHEVAQPEEADDEAKEAEAGGESDEADPVAALIDQLYGGEKALTDDLRAAFAAQGEAAIPGLIDLLKDDDLWLEDSEGEGYVSIHAARLLGHLQAAEAVEPLIEVIAESDPDDILANAALMALEQIGAPAAPGLLRFLRYSRDLELRALFAWPLGVVGRGSEAAYEALTTLYAQTTWDDFRDDAATVLGEFGERRAVPLLRAALDDPAVTGWNRGAAIGALLELGEEVEEEELEIDEESEFEPALLKELIDENSFRNFISVFPPDWRANSETIAHTFTGYVEKTIAFALAETFRRVPPEIAGGFTALLHGEVDGVTLDADVTDWPEWERTAYDHLETCAWPELRERVLGVYQAFTTLALHDYDAEDDPNDLIATARDRLDDDAGEALDLLGRAGALALSGKPLWYRWSGETEPPLRQWTSALADLVIFLQDLGQWPLKMGELVDTPEADKPPPSMDETLSARLHLTPEDEAFLADLHQAASPELPEALIRRVPDLSPALVPALIGIVNDDDLWDPAAKPGRGWPPIHAVSLLGHLRAALAVSLLIDLVVEFDDNAEGHYRASEALGRIGPPAAEAILLEMKYGTDRAAKVALAPALAIAGRGDSRAVTPLIDLFNSANWREGRAKVAESLGLLKDPSAVTPLRAALDDRRARLDDLASVIEALESLGVPAGTDPAVQSARRRVGLILRKPVAPSEWKNISRNAPCPCGSGKKFKYCHGSGEFTVH